MEIETIVAPNDNEHLCQIQDENGYYVFFLGFFLGFFFVFYDTN